MANSHCFENVDGGVVVQDAHFYSNVRGGGGGYNVLCNSKYYLISTIAILLDIKESKEYQNVHHKIRLYLYRIPCNVFCTMLEGEF